MKYSVDTDLENRWIYKIQNGDKDSFEALYKFYYPKLISLGFRYNNSRMVAEDLVHNVFYNVWKNRNRIKQNGKLRVYLYTAVRNQSIKYINRKKREEYGRFENISLLSSSEITPEEYVGAKEFETAIKKAISALPEKRREIFLMSREGELTYREIADNLNVSIKTVETQMSRSLKFLRFELSQFLPHDVASRRN